VPDYTDPWLLPFPGREDHGAGAEDIEALARAVDPLLVAQDARLTALATRPTLIVRRSADVAYVTGDPLSFNTTDHSNAGILVTTDEDGDALFVTPEEGAHPVAGVYPAVWRVNANLFFVASAPVAGSGYRFICTVSAYDPSTGGLGRIFPLSEPSVDETEAAAGIVSGSYLNLSYCVVLPSQGSFVASFSASVNGTIKANSFFSLTRIRGL